MKLSQATTALKLAASCGREDIEADIREFSDEKAFVNIYPYL